MLSGGKDHTIRWREMRISPGPLRLYDEVRPERDVTVMVSRCTDMPLKEAAAFVGRADEWPDEIMLAGMRQHYPKIAMEDTVQVIEFNLIEKEET